MRPKAKIILILLVVAVLGLTITAALHEPTLTPSQVEETLDASKFQEQAKP
jgi:hypothetical protein